MVFALLVSLSDPDFTPPDPEPEPLPSFEELIPPGVRADNEMKLRIQFGKEP